MPGPSFVFPNDVHIAWTVMIVVYPYMTGLVAGAFVVSAMYYVFRFEVLKPVARLALVTSFCFCAFATLPLLLHLHHPERALQVMITPSTTSVMAGFGFIYSAYMLILTIIIWLVFRPEIVERAQSHTGLAGRIYRLLALGAREITPGAREVDEGAIRALSIVGIPTACFLTGYVGFLFGGVKANPWWSTSLLPVVFVVSAIVSGIAVLILLYVFISWRRRRPVDTDCLRALSRYLWLYLALAVSLEMLELVHVAYEGDGEWPVISSLLTERLSVSFGLVQVLIGAVIPLLLLPIAFRPRRSAGLEFLSCLCGLLVLVQVFAMRWNVIIGGQLISKSFRGFVEYELHWGGREGLGAAAVILILPLVALWIAGKLLPLWSPPAES